MHNFRPSLSFYSIPIIFILFLANQNYAQQLDSPQSDSPVQSPPKEGGIDTIQSAESDQQLGGAQSSSPKCGNVETDYAPCLAKERADQLFKHCCSQYVPAGCHSLCQYEADELTARNLLLQAVKSKKCDLKHFGTILYCASQNQDNRKCCQHLNLADAKLGVGERCLRFCDPGGEGGIESIARSDVTCLFNWNVLMYCHHAGIKLI